MKIDEIVNTVVCGDCLEVMRELPDGCVDAVITVPPYGVEFRGNAWDKTIPPWIEEGRRIAKTVIVVAGTTTIWDYPPANWVCCWYRPASNSRSKCGGFSHWSPVLVYGKCKFAVDTINLHAIQHAYPHGFPHPSPKPEALMEWLVSQAASPNALILDPFLGSGTTAIAAMRTGRRFIGIEISEEYCQIARDRIAAEQQGLTVAEMKRGK